MSDNIHRERANASRASAAETELPEVRQRYLRSAEASEAMANREEKMAAKIKVSRAEAAQKRAIDGPTTDAA